VTDDPVDVSVEFLLAVRKDEETTTFERRLADYESEELARELDSDDARLAFWINLYNAATQQALKREPDQYDNRRTFFTSSVITVAGVDLSLDDIEHGILRRSYSKFTLGYLRRPFRGRFKNKHELSERDPRIHFALNCGAESCPPIAAYTRDRIDEQLDWATEGYLAQTVEYDTEAGTVQVPRLLLWFRGDWGRKRDLVAFLRAYDLLPDETAPSLSYQDWSWSFTPAKYFESETAPARSQD
jgi:hypothetical protein